MKFQIKHTKDWMRGETSRILRMVDDHKQTIEALEEDLKFMEKCREEINKANKLLREK